MKILLLFFALCLFTASCRNNDMTPVTICGVRDPLNELPWLKAQMDDARQRKEENYTSVMAIDYQGETLIQVNKLYMSCRPCILFHCDGRRVDMTKFSQASVEEITTRLYTPGRQVTLWPK